MKSQGRLLLFAIIVADLLIVLAVVGMRLIKSHETAPSQVQNTSSPRTTPGLVVYGSVRRVQGGGVENVSIFRSYASYPGVQIATTDAAGYYQSNFYAIPGDEMVTVWAESAGLVFVPANCYWRHYAGFEMRSCNFAASPVLQMFLPLLSKTPR